MAGVVGALPTHAAGLAADSLTGRRPQLGKVHKILVSASRFILWIGSSLGADGDNQLLSRRIPDQAMAEGAIGIGAHRRGERVQ